MKILLPDVPRVAPSCWFASIFCPHRPLKSIIFKSSDPFYFFPLKPLNSDIIIKISVTTSGLSLK